MSGRSYNGVTQPEGREAGHPAVTPPGLIMVGLEDPVLSERQTSHTRGGRIRMDVQSENIHGNRETGGCLGLVAMEGSGRGDG